MIWQDIVLTIGNFVFLIALFPTVFDNNKPPLSTSIPTGLCLLSFAIVYFSLNLWYSSIVVGLAGLTWSIIAYQRFKNNLKG